MTDKHTATIQRLLDAGGPEAAALTGMLLEYGYYKGRAQAADKALNGLVAENKRLRAGLWTCPDCAFTFDASHVNADGSGLSCSVCETAHLVTENERLRAAMELALNQGETEGMHRGKEPYPQWWVTIDRALDPRTAEEAT